MLTVILLLWALPVVFITGFAFGVYEAKSLPVPVDPPKERKRAFPIIIDGEFIRHN